MAIDRVNVCLGERREFHRCWPNEAPLQMAREMWRSVTVMSQLSQRFTWPRPAQLSDCHLVLEQLPSAAQSLKTGLKGLKMTRGLNISQPV